MTSEDPRLEVIRALRAERHTYAEIGAQLGITKQRAHQIATAEERRRRRSEILEAARRLADVRGGA